MEQPNSVAEFFVELPATFENETFPQKKGKYDISTN
ncbi:hypothetical protein BFJ68_g16731 [Fusarium oxysporum]|uniref:Uncharacterized protein n=1 Tax=Fusarium oxysporum TaxID=5507 RepID=A0A420P9Y7_FUSOX|nr:hypothetical protein BFJ71_g16629 [Fusarium oxysporum]RKK89314.1 hypothetical protein BFJ68_g16731 [Fusarium oxysporum]